MEVLKLVIELVKVLVWPITVLLILFSIRSEVKEILGKIKSAEIGKVKVELSREIKELKESVDESDEIREKYVEREPTSTESVISISDQILAVAKTRLGIEEEIIRLSQIDLSTKASKWNTKQILDLLKEKEIISSEVHQNLIKYLRISNELIQDSKNTEDLLASHSIGNSLLSHLCYIRNVRWLVRDFDANLVWQTKLVENKKYHIWSVLAATLPEYDYNYEILKEAAEKFNNIERKSAVKNDRKPRLIEVPTVEDFVDILEFRRHELNRILQSKWWNGYEWEKIKLWHWPEKWGKISWNGAIVKSANQAEIELLRTDTALEMYRKKIREQEK
ncbi:MAG: hypothetical protein GTO45_32165 [Candidatus Aminicenantes bacterium]|nr:hypothetical protein [Candidatus Aminicenantes bacterium]NIM83405.1 hypothetical protein [Candidatus Aminicenantes bacterium]NIN22797.1 hypothetical protein [Candidatus Aminicenantes bacterium]NIN46531.1 hypothetical protein [Candidatus Aminicenantes bacterium]NIN89436.1 hypothetical protein [Candidatus Aminicenantes bacterium]